MSLSLGSAQHLGATLQADGVNFALAAPHAEAVDLCLFDASGRQQTACLRLPGHSDGIWHGFLPGASAGCVYGWRVHGPWAPAHGHRFNPAKLLLDPYAREVLGHYQGQSIHNGHQSDAPHLPDPRDNAAEALKARVVAELPPPLPGVTPHPASRVLYELHTKGFTALHPDIPAPLRGSYAGLAHPAAIAHLRRLGITTVCLMPVAQRADEVRLLRLGLSNYWGYSPVAWNAPEPRYWSGTPGSSPRSEFKALIDRLHQAGLEVILDVVYNHTAETDAAGPTLSLRGIDNANYYHLDPANPAEGLNWTGCGNCVNLHHPLVLRTVMDSLRYWVQAFGVDGFRFDLAPVLARGGPASGYRFSAQAPLLMALSQDPVLRDKLMVAEPWDIGPDGYQLGQFPPGWLEWNDRFRDTQRSFWLRGQTSLGTLAQRVAGSSDVFDPANRRAASSVNFVCAHDGFTLADLVSYAERHNQANGEDNRDGHAHNLSNNLGQEGPTDDPQLQALRLRYQRALLASTVLALGTPMLLAGDEIGHSQHGNNNAYCQDNPTTWLHWEAAQPDLPAFVARLVQARRARPVLQAGQWWQPAGASGLVARWLTPAGEPLTPGQWNDPHCRSLLLHLALQDPAASATPACLLLIHGGGEAHDFCLPPGRWWRHLDSHSGETTDNLLNPVARLAPGSVWLASEQPLDTLL